MLLSAFFVEWFAIDFTFFRLNLGWFAVLYSALHVWRNLTLQREMALTDRELHDYGERLSAVTPLILDRAAQGVRPRAIAAELVGQHGIPELVSLKYMVALSKVRGGRSDAPPPEGEGPPPSS